MTRPIRWDIIEQNYDQLIKYATAIRVGTASTEAILRRFIRNASHPTSRRDQQQHTEGSGHPPGDLGESGSTDGRVVTFR